MRFILEEQRKYLQSFTNNVTYHPMKPNADVKYQAVNLFSSDKCFYLLHFRMSTLHSIKFHYNSKVRTYHCSTCIEYIYLYQNRGKIKVRLTLGITTMLLQTKKNSNQSLMVIVAWLPELTGHFHVENLKNNESLNVNLEKKNKLINCFLSQNISKHKLTAYLMYLCYYFLIFTSTLRVP